MIGLHTHDNQQLHDDTGGNVTKALLITVSGDSIEEIRGKIRELAKEFGVIDPSVQIPLALSSTADAEAPAEKKKPGRQQKAAATASEPAFANGKTTVTPAENELFSEATPPPAAPVTPPATQEQATEALKKVNSAKGLPAAREILLKFGANRMSELKSEHFGAFVLACAQVLV